MTALTSLLAGVADPAQPFITYYDDATGERVELSATTTANWVAKTSNFLIDALDVEPGMRIRLGLPTHWESLVWILSSWNVGAVLVDSGADIAVVGPDLDADEPVRVALSLRPMGLRFAEEPDGFVDYNAEVLGHSDWFQAIDPPTDDSPAIDLAGTMLSHRQAAEAQAPLPGRLLVEPDRLERDWKTLVGVCRGNGSLVIAAHAEPERRDRIAADERAQAL